ncbi:PTS sugar transporter subunit IIA [Oceanobacillus jeddahense]|uniref:PTS sugar transporter subunit IIA n=1 Tax=Oceanobacillus jeddahense TaxID=1462527 RepID=UPI000595AC65|nr:PTS sugar transporter subunit IIA [Oceanobacillus jeddahense]
MLKEYLHHDLVFNNLECNNFDDVLTIVMKTLTDKNYVDKGFQEALILREDKYPTGLKLKQDAVAIPHGGVEYVRKNFIAVVTLKSPIPMHRMDEPTEIVMVDILFILGFKSSETHLDVLRQLMEVIQNQQLMTEIKNKDSLDHF